MEFLPGSIMILKNKRNLISVECKRPGSLSRCQPDERRRGAGARRKAKV
jgi:hypothetical protein